MFNNQPDNPKILLFRVDVNPVVLSGEDFAVSIPVNFSSNKEIAVKPQDSDDGFSPDIVHPVNGNF